MYYYLFSPDSDTVELPQVNSNPAPAHASFIAPVACYHGDSMVTTPDGNKPMNLVRISDMVIIVAYCMYNCC